METFLSKIKIYLFPGLTELKDTYDYYNYLIICYDGEEEKVWYLFERKLLWDSYKDYFKEKLGITDPGELQLLLDEYNKTVKDESFDILLPERIRRYKYINTAITDKDIKLTTRDASTARGFLWYKNNGGLKNGDID